MLWYSIVKEGCIREDCKSSVVLPIYKGKGDPIDCGVDIGDNADVELVDKFCCLGNVLSEDGDADAAVETRI